MNICDSIVNEDVVINDVFNYTDSTMIIKVQNGLGEFVYIGVVDDYIVDVILPFDV